MIVHCNLSVLPVARRKIGTNVKILQINFLFLEKDKK